MIIQCRQCRTKFRFDDNLMHGAGVWLRCSRCGHVYFQENALMKPEKDLPSEPVKPEAKALKKLQHKKRRDQLKDFATQGNDWDNL
ncbi:hypothetical protein ER57_10955 [Smithella sp. SCADC]|nr:hypothetical protein ER57_10955 [Smithella sp. SCADC]